MKVRLNGEQVDLAEYLLDNFGEQIENFAPSARDIGSEALAGAIAHVLKERHPARLPNSRELVIDALDIKALIDSCLKQINKLNCLARIALLARDSSLSMELKASRIAYRYRETTDVNIGGAHEILL